jgi:hypothetical protein
MLSKAWNAAIMAKFTSQLKIMNAVSFSIPGQKPNIPLVFGILHLTQ